MPLNCARVQTTPTNQFRVFKRKYWRRFFARRACRLQKPIATTSSKSPGARAALGIWASSTPRLLEDYAMPKSFTITSATDVLKTDDKGHAEAVFIVTTHASSNPRNGKTQSAREHEPGMVKTRGRCRTRFSARRDAAICGNSRRARSRSCTGRDGTNTCRRRTI